MITTASITKNISLMTSFFAFVGGLMHLLTAFYPSTGYDIFDSVSFSITGDKNGRYLDQIKFNTLGLIIPGAVICGLGLIMIILVFMIDDGSVPMNEVKKSHENGGKHTRSGNGLLYGIMGFSVFVLLGGIYFIFHSLMLSSTYGTTDYIAFVNENIFKIKVQLSGEYSTFGDDLFRNFKSMTYNIIGTYLIALFYYGSSLILAGATGAISAFLVTREPPFLELKKPVPEVIEKIIPAPDPVVPAIVQNEPPQQPQPPFIPNNDQLPVDTSNNNNIHSSINNSNIHSSINNDIRNSQNSVNSRGSGPRVPMPRPGRVPNPNGPRSSMNQPRNSMNQPRGGPTPGRPRVAPTNGARPPTATNVMTRSRPSNVQGGNRPRAVPRGPPRAR